MPEHHAKSLLLLASLDLQMQHQRKLEMEAMAQLEDIESKLAADIEELAVVKQEAAAGLAVVKMEIVVGSLQKEAAVKREVFLQCDATQSTRTGRWQRDGQLRFLTTMRDLGVNIPKGGLVRGAKVVPWPLISGRVMTRTPAQCRTHAQEAWLQHGYRVWKMHGEQGYDLVTPNMTMTMTGFMFCDAAAATA